MYGDIFTKKLNDSKMPLLKTISEEEATSVVKKVYDGYQSVFGKVPNVIKFHSASQTTFNYLMGLLNEFSNNSEIDPLTLTFLRIIIPHRNGGTYCVKFQSKIIKTLGVSDGEIEKAKNDPGELSLDEKRKSLLLFAIDVIEGNHNNIESRLTDLRNLGWTDKNIYEICFLGALQKAMIPLVESFKVENDY